MANVRIAPTIVSSNSISIGFEDSEIYHIFADLDLNAVGEDTPCDRCGEVGVICIGAENLAPVYLENTTFYCNQCFNSVFITLRRE